MNDPLRPTALRIVSRTHPAERPRETISTFNFPGNPGLIGQEKAACELFSGQQLYGAREHHGFSFAWQDFRCQHELAWSKSFPLESVIICLNLEGHARLFCAGQSYEYGPQGTGFYCQGKNPLGAVRLAGQRHQFLTIHYSHEFIRRYLAGWEGCLHPLLRAVLKGSKDAIGVMPAKPLSCGHHQLVLSLREPPVSGMAQQLWYLSKALELMVEFFVQPTSEKLFCTRQSHLAQERVRRALLILQKEFANPPTLEELSGRVGCSQFYLSRTFSAEMGKTIPQYVRQLRLERAAELLKTGRFNVTEAALEVGYSSVSHFSEAFRQTFGCCPGLYPLATETQKAAHLARWNLKAPAAL